MNKEDLEKLSDNEINLLISASKYKAWCIENKRWDDVALRNYEETKISMKPHEYTDYCNSWGDMGPLIDEFDIDLQHDYVGNGLKHASDIGDWHYAAHRNILRAAAIVYLLMQES